jgi:hypothetical protein
VLHDIHVWLPERRVKTILSVENVAREEKYLCLPTLEERMNKDNLKSTKKMAKRFTSWAQWYMSGGANEVLIKSVTQAIPTYVMGVFKLPTCLCEELTSMIRYF